MKKYFYYLFALTALVMFSSCIDNDEPNTKQSFTSTMNCRAIDGDDVLFSQGNAKVEVNFTDALIKITCDYKDINGVSSTLTTPEMQMTTISSSIYQFASAVSQTGTTSVESFGGYIDMSTGMMWYTISTSTCQVVCTTHLLYAYTNTTITNPDNGNHGSHEQSAYLFALDTRGQTCTLRISNFMCNLNSAVDVTEIQYDDLTVTPTPTGYVITADEAESSFKGYYKLTDVNFVLNNQCQVINGTFKCNGHEFSITGSLFNSATLN